MHWSDEIRFSSRLKQMAVAAPSGPRVSVDGKFFRLGEKKFYVKGVTYGPFAPNAAGQPFASPEQTATDFAQIRELGANTIRIYHVPARWFLDLASDNRLKVLIDIPWSWQLCFLDSKPLQDEAISAVRRALYSCGRHPAVFAFSLANEIPADVVRWSGAEAVAKFLDQLVTEAKKIDPECLCTFGNFPPTEFLRPLSVDFVSFNLYLHNRTSFRNYLARLQMVTDSKPLLLSEFGIDSLREGEDRKSDILGWQIEETFRAGLAGSIIFSYTDDWWRDGREILDWELGLVTRQRQPKPAFSTIQRLFKESPKFPLRAYPKVSVVVASYNGERTLKACLDSLTRLNYPDYEVILVDDGSTDTTRQVAFLHTSVRYFRHEKNLGLSVARNTGISAATGEVIAFTDADCRADEDWLYYLVGDLIAGDFAGVGGPNLLPPEDSAIAAAVMASPGGPAHVMLTDRRAEHIPGCNMAFLKSVLVEVGGFDPIFRKAGDDVDICWRVAQAGHQIGFSPSAFVWHYRRSTIREYLKQQSGYGEAESMLVRKHPEYFNAMGGSIWHGRIYTSAKFGVLLRPSIIYRGLFGSAGFQFLYAARPALTVMLCTSLEYHLLFTLPLWILSGVFHALFPVAITSLLIPVGVCAAAGAQASLARKQLRWWSRGLVALLFFLQPIVRGWARYHGRLTLRPAPLAAQQTLDSIALRNSDLPLGHVEYWADPRVDRLKFVTGMLRRLDAQGWRNKSDEGWSDYDVEIYGSRWSNLQITTVAEDHPLNRQLLRCRLRPIWSLRATALFWALCAVELVVIGFVGASEHWLWLLLLTLPLFAWFLRREKRTLQSTISIFLDDFAKSWKLTRIQPPKPERVSKKPAAPVLDPKSPFAQPARTAGLSEATADEKKELPV
jgi:glycosyltransferase involved in cell wall biosynthesis